MSFILLSIISFILLAKFYPPLNRKLFGGEFPISFNEIQFWVKKVPDGDYYRIYARYLKSPATVTTWGGHSIFFADSRATLGFNDIFLNTNDNKIYGGGSEIERGWEWAFYCLGEGKIEDELFKPAFPKGTKFTFLQHGSLEITDAPGDYITIYLSANLNKLERKELEKPSLAEIVAGKTKIRK
jgi:hypothetical protein